MYISIGISNVYINRYLYISVGISLTLEKDKEDQSKFYLSYPKSPVLDMKWANRDIKGTVTQI